MKKLIEKPYLFFLGIIPVLFIFGYLNKGQSINLEYFGGIFSIRFWPVTLFSCVFFLLISFNYLTLHWTDKRPKKVLSALHIILQLISFLVFYYYKSTYQGVLNESFNQINSVLILSVLLFIFATMIHLINFFAALTSKSK
ncbi:MAG: hypothetical protein HWD85_12605 [Flavobacteriaceae bacterium]|nr:hypothetical protein [Flavobacteriaceae bacterium]